MTANNRKLISVVFSFRNEEEVLSELINRVDTVFNNLVYNYELIFVNDDSSDDSLEILENIRANNNRIRIINMSRRFGVGPCVIAGFKHCSGDSVIYMDTDLQDPPELIPDLITQWEKGYDVVHTTRTKRLGENPIKMYITKLGYHFINLFSEIDLPMNTGDFKLLSHRALNAVLELNEHDPFIRGLSIWVGYKQTFVNYERQARFKGKTHFPILSPKQQLKDIVRGITTFSIIPMHIALVLGFIISISAFVYLIKIIIEKLFLDLHLPGWPAMMVTMLFLGGTILFTIGVLGIYIGKIHKALKGRPRYIIESKKGFDYDSHTTRL